MCGILGVVGKEHQNLSFKDALQALKARGPDAYGEFRENEIALAHRRLAIMDISVHSAQPMQFEDLVMVFNGAVYNYRDIRTELENAGYRFYSDGDTEVILKAYHRWGKAALEKFNGMFAIAIWDRNKKRLFAARDRLGIKPFYYTLDNGVFKFASNTQALLALGVGDTALHHEALNHYFSFHTIVPPPDTLIRGIKKLPQATTLEFDLTTGTLTVDRPYWHVTPAIDPSLSHADYVAMVREKLQQAINRRLTAAVDVGVLLSGGLDSSLITAMAVKNHPNLHTFSIGFESSDEEKGDEFEYSDIIANHYQTHHQKIVIDRSRMLQALPKAVHSMAEPMGSHDAIGFYLISQEVSRSIKVVQSGQGADEVFGGYHWYPKIQASGQEALPAYRSHFFDRSNEELKALLRPIYHLPEDTPEQFVHAHFTGLGDTDAVTKALHIDSTVMLVDDPVKRVDNMTMAWGLEARVPFLDHELVELAFKLPASEKIGDGGKGVLKAIARQILPPEVIDRPKGYFPVPALKYIRGEFLSMIRDTLDAQSARERGIVDRKMLNRMLQQPDEQITKMLGNTLWQYAVLEMWLQSHHV